jgi:dTDP-4-amino-4,6-dideoxygalactose transaminase
MHRHLSSAGQLSFISEESFAAALAVRGHFRFPAMRPSIPPPERWIDYLQKSYAARWFANFGPVVRDFEERLTARFAAPGEVMLTANNCTSAITAALIAFGARGDMVVPAFSFAATAAGVMGAGGRPLIVDVDSQNGVLDPTLLEEVLSTCDVGAVVMVVPFGIACELTQQLDVCARYGVPVVIDNASGLGGPVVPLWRNAVEVYSMHATKPFAVGEGGAIRTHPSLTSALRYALNFGLEHGTPLGSWGINGKMPEVLAAVGMAVLDEYDEVLSIRQTVAEKYIELLAPFEGLKCRGVASNAPWHGFPVQLPSSDCVETLVGYLASRSVDIRRYYRPSLEDWPGTIKLAPSPNARRHADTTITLPVYSDMNADEFEVLAVILRAAFEQFAGAPKASRVQI